MDVKLYYYPGACSTASHIVIKELDLPVTLVLVDLATKTTDTGQDFHEINPDGYVPALMLDDGSVLTESPALLQYLADQAAPNNLLPAIGDIRRYRVIEILAFISTEIHQSMGALVNPAIGKDAKTAAIEKVQKRLHRLERLLLKNPYLTGAAFTIADAYAFAIVSGARHHGVPLDDFPNVGGFLNRVGSRPATVAALRAEGLIS